MARLIRVTIIAIIASASGCSFCDTCDDFPLPCVNGNCSGNANAGGGGPAGMPLGSYTNARPVASTFGPVAPTANAAPAAAPN